MVMLVGIKNIDVNNVWETVSPMLGRALAKSTGDYNASDILAEILSRDQQLWVWVEDGKIEACCTTKIIRHPRATICTMPLVAGTKMKDWLSSEETMIAWAKENGCTQMEGYARDGWLRVLKNWRKVWTTIRRDI